MFKNLFEKASDVVYHTIGPYAAERERFVEHCRDSGFARTCLKQAASIVLTAALDLQAHGGLDVDQALVEAAATRIEKIRAEVGVTRGAREYRRAFVRYATRGFSSRGISRARNRGHSRTQPCSTTSCSGWPRSVGSRP